MFLLVLAVTAVLVLLGAFYLLGHFPLRIRGLRVFRLRSITFVSPRVSSSSLVPLIWLLDSCQSNIKDETDSFFRETQLAFKIENCRLGLDRVNWKLALQIGKISIVINRVPLAAQPRASGSIFVLHTFFLKFSVYFMKLVGQVVKMVLGIKIEEFGMVFTHLKDDREDKEEYWNCLQVRAQDIKVFQGQFLITSASLMGEEYIISAVDKTIVHTRQVLDIPAISVGLGGVRTTEVHVSVKSITVNLWPTVVLLFTSAFAPLVPSEGPSPVTAQSSSLQLLPLILVRPLNCELKVDKIRVILHYPVSRHEETRFEAMVTAIDDLQIFLSFNPAESLVPSVLAMAKQARLSALGADRIGCALKSVIQRLFEVRQEGSGDDLVILEDIFLANCWPSSKPFDYPNYRQQKQWIDMVMIGSPVWKILHGKKESTFESSMSELRSFDQSMTYQQISKSSSPIQDFQLRLLEKTVVIKTTGLTIDVPYEFPLSNFIDHLVFFVKASEAPIKKQSDRQPFNIFQHSWDIRLLAQDARLRINDDAFEQKLSKSFRLRRELGRKFERLDRRFWKRLAHEREKLGTETSRSNVWMAPRFRFLVLAATEPEALEGNPIFVKPYVKLQETLFSIYRKLYLEAFAQDGSVPLFQISAQNVDFGVDWRQDFVDSSANLLNVIDGECNFSETDVTDMGLLLGGFSSLAASNVEVTLRDYAYPLVYSRDFRAMGLLFLIEEASYPEAKSHNLIAVSPCAGRWSLRGLDAQGRAAVQRTILPIKVFHSLQISLNSPGEDDPVVSGFSPLYEGAFQMLDRAFELFSKPSEDRSPFLPFWDKMRIFLRGDSSSIVVRGPGQLFCIAGTNLHSTDETLSLVFPKGFILGLAGQDIRWQVPAASIYISSRSESILLWLHRTVGKSFDDSDREVLAIPTTLEGHIPILSFPSMEVVLSLSISGLNGRRPIPHGSLKLCAASNRACSADADVDFDSFRFFRTHQLGISFHVISQQTEAKTAQLLLYYYRELEQWVVKHFLRYVRPPVKAGRLFNFGTLSYQVTPKLSSVLRQFKLEIDFAGLFCARALQYYDTSDFGGLLLRSYGATKIILAWRMSEIRHGSPYSGQWFHHFAEVNFGKAKLGMITRAVEEGDSELQSSDVPFTFRGVSIFDVIQASRLFYLKVNQACFKDDIDSMAVQRRLIESRLQELAVDIEEAAQTIRKSDPTDNVNQFVRAKRKLQVLLDQQELMGRFSKEEDPSKLISYYQFIIQNARMSWHQAARNCVFSLVDQQFQFFRCTTALKRLATLFRSVEQQARDFQTDSPSNVASPGTIKSDFDAQKFIDTMLLRSEGPIDAGPEDETLDETAEVREELMADPEALTDHGMKVTTRIDFELVKPQIVLIDTDRRVSQAAIVIVAQNATLKFGVVRAEELGLIVGRRTKVVLEQANVFAAFASDFTAAEWPPIFPTEYLLSPSTDSRRFHRLSDRLRATFVYDVSNQRFVYRPKVHSPLRALFGSGDAVRVDAGALALLTDSRQYTVLYDVIVNLLVYRDETQKMRQEQLQSIILATNLFQQSDLLSTVEKIQHGLLLKWRATVANISRHMSRVDHRKAYREDLVEDYKKLKNPWDELALVVDALRTARSNKDKLQHHQTRLLLDVRLARIQWTLLLDNGSILCEMTLEGLHDSLVSAPDGTQSNLIEIQMIRAVNRQPNAFYRTLLAPVSAEVKATMLAAGSGFRGIGTQGNTVRFFSKTRPPVSGIRIIEVLELNVSPLQAQLTYETADLLIKFFFPPVDESKTAEAAKAASDSGSAAFSSNADDSGLLIGLKSSIKTTASSFFSKVSERMDDEDVALMKTRSAEYCSFIYINVPASQHLISYKVLSPWPFRYNKSRDEATRTLRMLKIFYSSFLTLNTTVRSGLGWNSPSTFVAIAFGYYWGIWAHSSRISFVD